MATFSRASVSSTFPLNFSDARFIFRRHSSSDVCLCAEPEGRGKIPILECRSFRLCLHCLVYRAAVCRYQIGSANSYLKYSHELVGLGFVFLDDELKDEHLLYKKRIRDCRTEEEELIKLLDRTLAKNEREAVTRACALNMKVWRLVRLIEIEFRVGRLDFMWKYLVEAVNLLKQRNEVWPSWPDLNRKRLETVNRTVKLYDNDDHDSNAEQLILFTLLRLSFNSSAAETAEVCGYIKFHSRYLDQELFQISRFVADQSLDRNVQILGGVMAADDIDFCKRLIDLLDRIGTLVPPPTHRFSLRLYRLCLRIGKWNLADEVMHLRFTDDPDQQQVVKLLNDVLTKLRNNTRQPTDRILLNGEHDHDASEYKLPELISGVEEACQGHPWWVNELRQENSGSSQVHAGSFDSAAATLKPSSSLLRRCSLMMRVETNTELELDSSRAENREVSRLFIISDKIADRDTYSIPFSYIVAACENPIVLKWNGEERTTNIAVGVPYHCRVMAYHPVMDEWTVSSDMCQLSGPLNVEQAGAICVPFLGDCGERLQPNQFVFKIHKYQSQCALREYMADVRTQSTALWYANRFSKLTGNKFGVLNMLLSDLVLVYQDRQRDTILEFMTRERHILPARAVKFMKFTNNLSWKSKKLVTDLLEAFTHFTHVDSGGSVMVTDLQGWVGWCRELDNLCYTLTDPVIHCPGLHFRFGGTNCEDRGVKQFFLHVHPTCNHICQSLNLIRPVEYSVPEGRPSEPEPQPVQKQLPQTAIPRVKPTKRRPATSKKRQPKL